MPPFRRRGASQGGRDTGTRLSTKVRSPRFGVGDGVLTELRVDGHLACNPLKRRSEVKAPFAGSYTGQGGDSRPEHASMGLGLARRWTRSLQVR